MRQWPPKQVLLLPSLQSLLALALLLAVRDGDFMPLKIALQLVGWSAASAGRAGAR